MNDNSQKNQIKNLSVREATMDDAKLLLEWANDVSVREQSFNTEPIKWDSHIDWLQKHINSPDTRFYLLLENEMPVGQIRYDRDKIENSVEISFSVAKEHRGKRLGIKLLELTRQMALRDLNCEVITALVIKGNEASNKAFLRAGFEEVGLTERFGKTAHKFVWKSLEN